MKKIVGDGRRMSAIGGTAAMLVGVAWTPTPCSAEDGVQALEQVIVSATRADTALQRTPVSVGVVDRADIDAKGITQLNDLVGVIAGVTVPNGFSNMPQTVGIRGVGVSNPATTQAVGIYIDDVPLVRGYATALWDLPDIQRIEVLRGPQGTLYGQNTTAGAVKYVSLDPNAAPVAWASVGAGNHGALEAHGYVNGAIGADGLSGSLAFSHRQNDGFAYNATRDEDINRLHVTQFRAKLRLSSTPGLNVVLAVDGLQDRSDTNTINFPLDHPGAAPRVSFNASDAGAFRRDAGGVSLKIEAALSPSVTLRSITAWRSFVDDPTVADWSGIEIERYELSQRVTEKTFSQELQLQGHDDALTWTTGLMLIEDRFDFDRFTTIHPLAAPASSQTEALTHQRTTDLGAYGQVRYALDAQTGVTVGLRAYHTRQHGANALWRTDGNEVRTVPVYDASGLATTETGTLPRIGIDRQWSPVAFSYASIAQGAKFAGFNRAASSLISASVSPKPERVTTYEIGHKVRLADRSVTVNAALFYNDYRDYLASLNNVQVGGVLVTDAVVLNAGRARSYGADFEMAATLAPLTTWTSSLELLRTRFKDFANPTGAPGSNFVGNQMPNAPHVSLATGLHRGQPVAGGGLAGLDIWLQHLGPQFTDIANSQALKVPAQTYLNIDTTYASADRRWTFGVRVRNATGKNYVLMRNVIPSFGINTGYYNAPRTILATLRHDFD